MPHVTTLRINLRVAPDQNITEALEGLPKYCSESFREHSPGCWSGEFQVSCPEAPHLADGDFVDDLAPHFPRLLQLKTLYDAKFEFQMAVGAPAASTFTMESHVVALLAALGANIEAVCNDGPKTA